MEFLRATVPEGAAPVLLLGATPELARAFGQVRARAFGQVRALLARLDGWLAPGGTFPCRVYSRPAGLPVRRHAGFPRSDRIAFTS